MEFRRRNHLLLQKQTTVLLLFSHQVVSDSLWPHGLHAVHQTSLSFTISQSLLKFMSIKSVMPSNHLILCCPLLLLPSIFPSIRIFQMSQFFASGGQGIDWSFSISPFNEYSGLISFRIEWFNLLAIQRTLKSLNAITNHLWNLRSWPEIKPWAFGVGVLTPRP